MTSKRQQTIEAVVAIAGDDMLRAAAITATINQLPFGTFADERTTRRTYPDAEFGIGDRVMFMPVENVADPDGRTYTTIGHHPGMVEMQRAGYYHVRLEKPWNGYQSVVAMPTELERIGL